MISLQKNFYVFFGAFIKISIKIGIKATIISSLNLYELQILFFGFNNFAPPH